MLNKKNVALLLVLSTAALLAACGASGSVATNTPSTPPPADQQPEVIQGVATPSSVAVVTATNAQ